MDDADDAIATWSATAQARAVHEKEISSVELLDLYLDRIDRLDGPINAVVTLDAERARDAANAADAATMRGESSGPLHGLPVTIKDAIATEGIRSTGGAPELTDHVPTSDAPAVARLKAAGAVVFGKTNLPRWSGDMQSFNDVFGTTNNPWDVERVPGGSSGGAAAAVACGFTSFELGTDIGGSVRLPSHFCGVFGLKPSFGVIPQRGYLSHVGAGTIDADINVFGPIARSARDLDLLLGIMAGPAPEAAIAWRVELPECGATSLADHRIGVWLDDPGCPVESEYLAALRALLDRLSDAGARIEEAHPPVEFTEQTRLFFQLVAAAASLSSPESPDGPGTQLHRAWLQAQEQRARLQATWARWFQGFDALLCPVAMSAAFPHDHTGSVRDRRIEIDGTERSHSELALWNGLIGVVGLPSAVPPVARVAGGLPVGVQVVTPYLQDRRAVRLAGFIADVSAGYTPPPGFGPA
jgi:amidase